jgi:ankyrin repeat protein
MEKAVRCLLWGLAFLVPLLFVSYVMPSPDRFLLRNLPLLLLNRTSFILPGLLAVPLPLMPFDSTGGSVIHALCNCTVPSRAIFELLRWLNVPLDHLDTRGRSAVHLCLLRAPAISLRLMQLGVVAPLLGGRSLSNLLFDGLALRPGSFQPAYHAEILELDLSSHPNIAESLSLPTLLGTTVLCECYAFFVHHPPFVRICKLLLDAGADSAQPLGCYNQPLLHVVARDTERIPEPGIFFQMLLDDPGTDVNVRDSTGASPLYYVSSIYRMQLLLSRGASLDQLDLAGQTPLDFHLRALRTWPSAEAAACVRLLYSAGGRALASPDLLRVLMRCDGLHECEEIDL